MHYNRLILLVVGANVALLVHGATTEAWWASDGTQLQGLVIAAQANLLVATVSRQQYVINAIAWLATRAPVRWPLRLRWVLGKYYHLGGVHVGAALSGTLWYLAFVVSLVVDRARSGAPVSGGVMASSVLVVALLGLMVFMARPGARAKAHDRFEVTHRFCGWAVLVLVWINTTMFIVERRGDEPVVDVVSSTPSLWMLAATTACALWPWLLLRKVPITVERPSPHVALVRLHQGTTPPIGTTRAISRRPLVGWHHFANVPRPDGPAGYRMVVSRAGDWTSEFIDDPPHHVWVRGLPTVGVANVKRLFPKVVYVVTGSGIGPALGHLLAAETPSRLVWITKAPRTTYGDGLVDEIEAAHPDALIWNTDELGKPDVLQLAHRAYAESGAAAVVCISNRTVTWQVVHGFERCGVPAFGPIWDS